MQRKLLWVSPFSLHDTSSGAAVQCKAMLEAIAKRGVQVRVLGSFIFDSPRGTTFFPNLEEQLKAAPANQPIIINDEENGIQYIYTQCQSRSMEEWKYSESWAFFQYYSSLLNSFRPDICIGYGTGTSGIATHAEAKRRGIPFVYPLCNGNHPYYTFDDCELLMTESQATANLYAVRDRLNVQPHGIFIDPAKFVDPDRSAAQYVTIVNPDPSKGLCIFAKMAILAQKELPNVKFLAVDGRGGFADFVHMLHNTPERVENGAKIPAVRPYTAKMFKNVDIANHTNNMKEIYKRTKVLLAPSLAYESWGRVASEAVLNGAPTIVSANNGGGLAEAMAGVGYAVNAPERCLRDNLQIPSDEEIRPWMDALKNALKQDWKNELEAAKIALSVETSTNRVLEILEPLFARRAGSHLGIIQRGILRMEHNGSFK